MKTIMIDMDDVICTGGYLALLNKYLNKNYKIDDFKEFFLEDVLIPQEEKKQYFDYFFKEDVYKYADFVDGAKKTLLELSKHFDLYVCTAYYHHDSISNSGIHCLNKYNWLSKNLPFINPSHFVFINNKSMFKSDIKIDDRIDNLYGDANTKLLFDAWHNRNISEDELKQKGIIRVKNWVEIKKILLNID